MSFKSYHATEQPDGSLELSDPRPLVFSGRHGLIARFVLGEPDKCADRWRLSPEQIQTLAFPDDAQAASRVLVFEDADGAVLNLQLLESIHGNSGARTEMLFSLLPLVIDHRSAKPRIRRPSVGRTYAEDMILDGGTDAPNGTWRWHKTHLALGGVVLQNKQAQIATHERAPPTTRVDAGASGNR